jgi:hypothetical protein
VVEAFLYFSEKVYNPTPYYTDVGLIMYAKHTYELNAIG